VICSTEYEQSDCESTRRSLQSVRSYEEISNLWELRQRGWSSPTEIDINDCERRLFDISSALTSGVWDWVADIITVIDIATPRHLDDGWSRLKTEVYYEVVSALSAACISLVTFSVAEPAIWLYYCYLIDSLYVLI